MMVGGVLAALVWVEVVASEFLAAALLSSQSSMVRNNRHTSTGVSNSADTSITMEPLMMAAIKEANISAIIISVGNGASSSSGGIGVVV